MNIYGYAAAGFSGHLVSVEVDIRRGIPGLDIIGLPDGAVRESRDRVKVAIRRSGFRFPQDRILVNLSPAGIKKEGASYDLSIALGILFASGQLSMGGKPAVLCAGELQIDGTVRPVSGILSAVAAAMAGGIPYCIVPGGNLREARSIRQGVSMGIAHLMELPGILHKDESFPGEEEPEDAFVFSSEQEDTIVDLRELRGQPILRRALEIAASGGHHLLAFGPPGSGKTMGARTLAGILPDLEDECALNATRIWSEAGKTIEGGGLMRRPPVRDPHHSSSTEGIIGGGSYYSPGEISLAHGGVLFLDETPEFASRVLQSLREPLESGKVELARAGRRWWYPAAFQLLLTMNPCPCGNLGRDGGCCSCTPTEVSRYWRRLGGALLDRVELRVPVAPVSPETLLNPPGESSKNVRSRVERVRERQRERYRNLSWQCNSGIPPGEIEQFVSLRDSARSYFAKAVSKLNLSSRAAHGVLRVSRTLADMAGREPILEEDILEAVQHRRYGDRDLYWTTV